MRVARGWRLAVIALGLALPTTSRAASAVYAVNISVPPANGQIGQFAVGARGVLSPLTPLTVGAGSVPSGMVVSPDNRSAYVANAFAATVSEYDVNQHDGSLTPKSSPTIAAQTGPVGIADSPNGSHVYVVNNNSNTVSGYTVDPTTGVLSGMNPATVATGFDPTSIAVTPNGRNAYVLDAGAGTVSQYSIDRRTGAPSPLNPATVPTGASPPPGVLVLPDAIAVSPDGRNLYETNVSANSVSQFAIERKTGALTLMTPSTVSTGTGPEGIALAPSGRSAYIADELQGAISEYTVDRRTGALSPKTPASIEAVNASSMAVTANGAHLYAGAANNQVLEYTIVRHSGALQPNNPPSIGSGGVGPYEIAVWPSDFPPRPHDP